MHKNIIIIFSGRSFITIILLVQLVLQKTIYQEYNTSLDSTNNVVKVVKDIVSIILESYFMIVTFMAASGWNTIRFPSLKNELKRNYFVYLFILFAASSDICSSFFISREETISPYELLILIYMVFLLYATSKSYAIVDENYRSLANYYEEYNRCLSVKKSRFNVIFYLIIAYILCFSIIIAMLNIFDVKAYSSPVKIIFDDLFVMGLLILYKPSSVILTNHAAPNSTRLRKMVYSYSFHRKCYDYSNHDSVIGLMDHQKFCLIINPVEKSTKADLRKFSLARFTLLHKEKEGLIRECPFHQKNK